MGQNAAGVRGRQAVGQRAGIPHDYAEHVAYALPRREELMRSRAVWAGVAAFAVTLIVSHLRSSPYNNYVLLAQAFLHGHAWIDWPGEYIDALAYGGQHYVIEAPLPAVLLLPYVALAGTAANQTLLAVVLCAIGIGAAWRLGERLGVPASA